jgi:methylglutaconyl-CoA hydratase
MTSYSTLRLERTGDIARVFLNRPNVRNAFNEQMIADLIDAFTQLGADRTLRVIILGGVGSAFCAGADVEWMRGSIDRSETENLDDARAMVNMFRTIDECPAPVVGRVQRAAMGGGLGLVAVCDIVVADQNAKFSFSEARLGIIPAVISAFCLPKIGAAQARRYFLTGEAFTAASAPAGLVHEAVPEGALDAKIDEIADALCASGPNAVREAKALIRKHGPASRDEWLDFCTRTIARLRVSPEAQEGLRAFLDKREPSWRAKKQ